jgi:signal transduction histidine kinase
MSSEIHRELVFPGDGEMARLMRDKRWELTPLGPVEAWPAGLRSAVRIVLTSRFSMWMGWGDDLTFLYNDAYRIDTLGVKHPRVLGGPTRETWSEIWSEIGPRIAAVLADGRATWDEGLLLILERNDYREETYHTFSYSPLHDDDGRVRGVLCVVIEETGRLISERRVGLLGKLAFETAGARTHAEVLAGFERSLAVDSRDLPFTLTYLFDEAGTTARLVSRTGFATAPAADDVALDVDQPAPPFGGAAGRGQAPVVAVAPWPLREVLETGRPIDVPLTGAAWPHGPWALAPTRAVAMPIGQQGQARPAGVLIAGLNPHRIFDGPYREFISLVIGQLAAGLASAHAYEQERRRAEALSELDRAKTAFFSNVSHEFRTPLTLMLGPLSGLLGDPDVAPGTRDELAMVHRNGLRLLKLVNTMLDFSRIEAGRTTARFVPTDLAQLTSDLASVFRAATDKAGLRLIVSCPPLGAPVRVDRDMWEKIVLNLVSNAFKFTLEGEIEVALARVDDRVELSVRDSGRGIPDAELPHVFERFYRVEGTVGRTHEGTGIGLALVQELVRLHSGSISVTSELGRGTELTVSIPIDAGHGEAAELAAPAAGHGAEATAFVEEAMRWLPDAGNSVAPVGPATPRERLVIADDNADMRDYLRRLLGQRWDVETVANGRQALDAIRRRLPDLVITDVMMPELDGLGLIAELRADDALRELPVIMLSARAGEEARVEGLRAGATDYLGKPFASRELLARVETQLLRAAKRSAEQDEARRLAAIFEQAPMAIAILRGHDHVFEIANPPYRNIVGSRDLVGRTVADALPEVAAQGFIALLDGVFRTGEAYVGHSMPIRLQRSPDGPPDELFFDLVYQPLIGADGRVTGIAAIAHEVTALATARRDAETANRAKDEFLAMLGHELRNPLAPITTALELMRLRPNLGAERERAVIERQVHHLVKLVDDLLDVSRITRGKVELRPEPLDIADVVAQAVEVVSPLLEQHRHQLAVDVPAGLSVDGDRARLTQIVSNLLTNAAKYTRAGGQITVAARREDGHAMISVTDNGVGIEPTMLQRVFEPFAQEHQSIDRAQGGLGLGLAIVDNLVKLHGGTAVAASAGRGHGSTFTVRLPLRTSPQVSRPEIRLPRAVTPSQARILIIDDNIDAAQLLAELLAADGYRTVVAHDGPSALQAAHSFEPQIAVVDLGLPIMDGYELGRHLLARPSADAIRLIALTGYGQAQDRAKTAAAGFEVHLVKPVDIDQLRSAIERLRPHTDG